MIKHKDIFCWISILAISLIILGCNQNKNVYPRACQKLVDIGKNEDKIKYIYSWFKGLEKEKDIFSKIGWLGKVRFDIRPFVFEELNIDMTYLGLNKNTAHVTLNREFEDMDFFDRYDNIKSVSVGDGRSTLIVKMSSGSSLGVRDIENYLERIIKVNESVSVFCDE